MTQTITRTVLVSPPLPVAKPRTPWAVVCLLALSGLGVLGSFGLAAGLVLAGVISQFDQSNLPKQPTETLSLAFTTALTGVLLVPTSILALMRILGKPLPAWSGRISRNLETVGLVSIPIWLLVLVAGQLAESISSLRWLLIPPLQLLAGALPVAWLVLLGKRKLSTGSPLRSWGILGIEISVTFTVILVAELVLFVGLAGIGLLWLAANPGIRVELNQLLLRMMNLQQMDSATLQRMLEPYLSGPAVAYIGLTILAGLIPLIEELLKPLAIWFLARRLTTPAQGFAAGLICGGGFALVESLGRMGSAAGDQWASVAIGRAGTDLLHIFTGGLMGWALVGAWRQRKFLQLGLTYFLSVLTHGLWNGLALWMGFTTLLPIPTGNLPFSQRLGIISPIGLLVLAIIMFIVLLRSNHQLQEA